VAPLTAWSHSACGAVFLRFLRQVHHMQLIRHTAELAAAPVERSAVVSCSGRRWRARRSASSSAPSSPTCSAPCWPCPQVLCQLYLASVAPPNDLYPASFRCPVPKPSDNPATCTFLAEDVLATCYLTCGKIAPDFEQLELSVGESTVAAAVVETTGASVRACAHAVASSAYPVPAWNAKRFCSGNIK